MEPAMRSEMVREELVRVELERILSSKNFLQSRRSQSFLRYVVERSLLDDPPKEYEIAVEVFARGADYDPAVDATVRVEAGRLRSRLREYYAEPGNLGRMLIEVPKGGYRASFIDRQPEGVDESVAKVVAMGAGRAGVMGKRERWLWPQPLWRWVVGGAAVVGIGAAFVYPALRGRLGREAPIRSLAVLPLENLSGDREQDYFADGLTDELITELAQMPDLRVVSRMTVMQNRERHGSQSELARELKVDAVIEGSVVRSGDRVRVNAQLVDLRNDRHLWAQTYEESMGDLLALEDDVVGKIATETRRTLGLPAGSRLGRVSVGAHDAYLRARYFFQKQDWPRSVEYFRQAIGFDGGYAAAYAGLADALDAQSTFQETPPDALMTQALTAARRAVELDPKSAEAYTALGSIHTIYTWEFQAAGSELSRALSLAPNYSLAEMKDAVYLDAMNRPAEAVEHMRRAVALDPLSFFLTRRMGATLFLNRQYDEALEQLKRAAEMEPAEHRAVDGWMSLAYEKKGMRDEAVQHDLLALPRDSPATAEPGLRAAYRRQGWAGYWRARSVMFEASEQKECVPFELALSSLRVEDRDRAFRSLARAVDQHCYTVVWLNVDPMLDPLRSDPRMRGLLERVHLAQGAVDR